MARTTVKKTNTLYVFWYPTLNGQESKNRNHGPRSFPIERLRHVKSKEAALRIISRRNKSNIIQANYFDQQGNHETIYNQTII